jgi:hypothetical protein
VLCARKCRRLARASEQDTCDYMNRSNVGLRIREGFALAGISE